MPPRRLPIDTPRHLRPRRPARRTGYAMLLVIIALAFASALGTAMILSRAPAAVASNVRLAGDARALAEAALEAAVDMAIHDQTFRTAYTHEAWSADQPFGPGTFRVKFADPDDADLADSNRDDVRITVRAEVDGRTHEVAALFTPPVPQLLYEVGKFTAGPTPTAVAYQNSYTNPVVVCTLDATNNAPDRPVVVRMQNVTTDGFEVFLQNPGDQSTPVADEVYFLAMEAGAHEFDGVKCEAWTQTVNHADRKGANDANAASYLQSYTEPIVVGQVMTANDSRWSTFWTRGSSRNKEPDSSTIRVGMHVGEDSDYTRSPETLGVIVMEAGEHTLGGAVVQAFITDDEIKGIGNNGNLVYKPDYPQPFDDHARYALLTQAGEDGGDMGFAVLPDNDPLHDDQHIHLAIDEDQIRDQDRNHTTERVFVIAFEDAPTANTGAGLNVLLVVDDEESMDQEDEERVRILQSFGMSVTMIDDDDSNPGIIAALEAADVVYISPKSQESTLNDIIDDLAVPFVNEHEGLIDDLGFAAGGSGVNEEHVELLDNTHPITAGFDLDEHLDVLDDKSDMMSLTGTLAAGAQLLADGHGSDAYPMMVVLDTGAIRRNGSPSPSRRVQMPWGESDFDPEELTGIGQELLRQSLIWAAGDVSRNNPWQTPPRLVWEEPDE